MSSSIRKVIPIIPAIGVALLPKLACPACWPAYAGLLSALGLGFLISAQYLLPLTGFFLALAVATLAWRARARRGYGPMWLGVAASAAVMIGKFLLDSNVAMYAGIGLLVAASVWNCWPRRVAKLEACPACTPAGLGISEQVHRSLSHERQEKG
jgi:hypothetical protein